MVSNWTLAKMFAEGATKGKGNHTFIEGDTIYSYGHHFPIAMRLGDGLDTILINEDKYSPSTSKHQSYVRSAIVQAGLKPMKSNTAAIQTYAQRQQSRKTTDQLRKINKAFFERGGGHYMNYTQLDFQEKQEYRKALEDAGFSLASGLEDRNKAEGDVIETENKQFEKRKPDLVDEIMAYEAGEMTPAQEDSFFRRRKNTLINLQGHYGRQLQARGLLKQDRGQGGYFTHRKEHSINRRKAYKRQ